MQTPEIVAPGKASWDQAIREVLHRPSEPARLTGNVPPSTTPRVSRAQRLMKLAIVGLDEYRSFVEPVSEFAQKWPMATAMRQGILR